MNLLVNRRRTHPFRPAAVRFALSCCSDPSAMLGNAFCGSVLVAVQHAACTVQHASGHELGCDYIVDLRSKKTEDWERIGNRFVRFVELTMIARDQSHRQQQKGNDASGKVVARAPYDTRYICVALAVLPTLYLPQGWHYRVLRNR